jgi:serine phosphatase RsbU (regulator of sigma subunit)
LLKNDRAENETTSLDGFSYSAIPESVPPWIRNRLFVIAIIFGAASFAAISLLPRVFYRVIPGDEFLFFHTIAEFVSILVSFAIFIVGWYGYKQNNNRRYLFIGIVFLLTAILDFAHLLAVQGIPTFLSINAADHAAAYYIVGRLINSFGLFLSAFVTTRSRRWWPNHRLLLAGGLALVGAVLFLITERSDVVTWLVVNGIGRSRLMFGLEGLAISFYAATIFVFWLRGWHSENIVLLQLAMLFSILAEIGFCAYRIPNDSFELIGYIYKIIANYLMFRAIFEWSFREPYSQLVKARDHIERSFTLIGSALASSLEIEDVLQLIVDLASDIIGCSHGAVYLLKDGELVLQAQTGIGAGMLDRTIGEHYTAVAESTQHASVVSDAEAQCSGSCLCRNIDGEPARSIVSAPIIYKGKVLGVVEIYSHRPNVFSKRQADLLSSFARQAAIAIHNSMRYEREREIAETLQRSLLPNPPDVPGLDIAVRYVPAGNIAKVGGDLYDIFLVDDDHLAVVIGDVCGHGLDAAATMAMTEYMIRGFVMHGVSPGVALQNVNLALCKTNRKEGAPAFVTVFLMIVDLLAREARYANAGHYMPIVISRDECKPLAHSTDLPLGVMEAGGYDTHTTNLRGASGLIMYTDGIVEARDTDGDFFEVDGLVDLCRSLTDRSSAELLNAVIRKVSEWSNGPLEDDISMLSVKWKS